MKKNKLKRIILLLTILVCLTGCESKYPELEKDAIGLKTTTILDEKDDDATYLAVEYNGRTYIPYGTIKRSIKKKDIDKCIGYLIQDENTSSIIDEKNKDTRIYTLKEDKENNFLMEYYIGTTLMNQPSFYRALDTKGSNIKIPKYIESLDYNYWKEE